MNIFLTGATGYVGSGIAQALQREGYEVIAHTRSDAGVARLFIRSRTSNHCKEI